MAGRCAPYRAKPPEAVRERMRALTERGGAAEEGGAASAPRLMVVQRPGPTSFVVQAEGEKAPSRVLIGSRVECTCMRRRAKGKDQDLCWHALFVLLKVLRVPPTNPIVWQLSLIDRELEEVLKCSAAVGRAPRRPRSGGGPKAAAAPTVQRPLADDGPCPICYEDFAAGEEARLAFCKGCGHNMHGRCLHVWANHQASIGKPLTCPLCREPWEDFKWSVAYSEMRQPARASGRERRDDIHYGTACGACRAAPLEGERFKCAVCAHFDLCSRCFARGLHSLHPFEVRATPAADWKLAERTLPDEAEVAAAPAAASAPPPRRRPAAPGSAGVAGGRRPARRRNAPPSREAVAALERENDLLGLMAVGLSLSGTGKAKAGGPSVSDRGSTAGGSRKGAAGRGRALSALGPNRKAAAAGAVDASGLRIGAGPG